MTQFNSTSDSIEWARWTWNPVTGCKHACPYCYARDFCVRLYGTFEPIFRKDRLDAPYNTKVPVGAAQDPSLGNVFVCSIADLFGEWVPREWIDSVLRACRDTPQWNYLFLTKNPARYLEFAFSRNCWVGTTADTQARLANAVRIFRDVKASVKFLSCEPLLEDIGDVRGLSMFDWVIIGAQSKTSQVEEFQPEFWWVHRLTEAAHGSGCKVYWKPNLRIRPREYPRQTAQPRQMDIMSVLTA